MQIIQEKIENLKELTDEQKSNLAKKIADNFNKWDIDRITQIDTAKKIQEEVYLSQPRKFTNKNQKWKSDVNLNGLYNIKKALVSVMWREIWANPNQMFDVRGTDERTEQQAKIQKAAIVDSLKKMKIGQQFDEAVANLLDIGEMIVKIDWQLKTKVVKRQNKNIGWILNNIQQKFTGAGYQATQFVEKTIPIYENARVESISPYMFVFDHSNYKLGNEASWNSCIKIYKKFETLENIKNNKVYSIKSEWIEELKNEHNETSENKAIDELRSVDKYGDNYSVLYAHGDFTIDGKIYKNYVAEVLANKYLIRFEENPLFINPFVLCALEFDPLTKRGITKLKAPLQMCREEERLTNLAFDVQSLTVNPVLLAQEGVFEDIVDDEGQLNYEPGKVIEYENGLANVMPTPITINASGISDLISLLNQKISDTSGVSNVMYGNIESEKRTATELQLTDKGSTAQISKDLDIIYQNFNLPIVEKVAELLAMFKDGAEFVYTQEKGKNIEYKITNEIRQAQYNYIYEDRNALNDRKMVIEKLYQVCQGAFQLPDLASQLNAKEIFTIFVEALGFDNIEKLFKPENAVTQFANQLQSIPQNFQEPVIQALQNQLQQMVQQYQAQQQQAQMQAQAQKQVQMQLLRDNARAEYENRIDNLK